MCVASICAHGDVDSMVWIALLVVEYLPTILGASMNEGLNTPTTFGHHPWTFSYKSVKSGGSASISEQNLQQLHWWNWTETSV